MIETSVIDCCLASPCEESDVVVMQAVVKAQARERAWQDRANLLEEFAEAVARGDIVSWSRKIGCPSNFSGAVAKLVLARLATLPIPDAIPAGPDLRDAEIAELRRDLKRLNGVIDRIFYAG